MKLSGIRVLAALLTVTALAVAPVFAGAEYEIEVTDHKREKVEMTKLQVEGSNFRMGIAADGRKRPGGSFLFQGDRREGKEPRVVIDDGKGGHIILNQAKMEEIAKAIPPGATPVANPAMIETMRMQAERIADPEARARALEELDKRFGPAGGEDKPQLEYIERGVRDKFGYPSVRYDVMRGEEKIAEVWATDWANLEGGRQTSKAFAEFESFYRSMMETLADAAPMATSMFGGDESPFQKIFELNRFPVATYQYEGGELVRSSVLKSASKVEHEPAVFKVDPNSVEREIGPR
jgi:hypothetical protein